MIQKISKFYTTKIQPCIAKATPPFQKFFLAPLIVICVIVLVVQNRVMLVESIQLASNIPVYITLLMILGQFALYYCNGKLFQIPLPDKVPIWRLTRASFEISFINNSVPYGELAGFFWLKSRVKTYSVPSRDLSFTYVLRYLISITTNQMQSFLAITCLLLLGKQSKLFFWTGIMNFIIAIACLITAFIYAKHVKFYNMLPIIFWATLYSLLEDAGYFIVAISFGHPEYILLILTAESIGAVAGIISPFPAGAGSYEIPMISSLIALGATDSLATVITLTGRYIPMISSMLFGFISAFLIALKSPLGSIRHIIDQERAESGD